MTTHRFAAGVIAALLAGGFGAGPGAADDPKPMKPVKPPPPQFDHPARDPVPVTAAVDREIGRALTAARVNTSPSADDAEFLRRAYLDLAGRIPTAERAAAFLDSTDPDKRRKLIDELLASSDFGRHLADLWRPMLAPRDPANTKPQADKFSPWLAEQFNRNRGWDSLAAELLGATGDVKDRPETTFLMSHAENAQPKPDLLAGAAGRVFLGVQLQCAECHDHPFAPWTQDDFWGVAAFFGKLRNTGTKGPPWVLTEDPDPKPLDVKNGGVERPKLRAKGVIVVPGTGGNKGAGREVPAKVLGGQPLELDDSVPFRPRFVEWVTHKDNAYFARAFVNRAWAQLFGRGLVNPVDNMSADNKPSHPAVLDLLASEFTASGFDIKHLYRCLCNTAAYQRTSRSAPGNESDATLFSRMAVKPVGPEALYDSLAVVYGGSLDKPTAPGGKPAVKPGEKPAYGPTNPRDEFVNFFRGQGGGEPGEFAHGIPQFLRRMNGERFDTPAPVIDRLVKAGAGTEKALETLYLTALARRPTAREKERMTKYIAGRPTPAEGYSGVLWVLLNSGEFVLNR
jgi:hypothetical protein